jgi:hypothetical protein
VVPSRFDVHQSSVILEGKSDYYVLRYAQRMLGVADLPLLPGLGAGTFGSLAALHVGWNLNCIFLLDGDRQGKQERERYAQEFGIPLSRLITLDQLVSGISVIEDLLDAEALATIQSALNISGLPSKAQVRRFFQERLASDKTEHLSPAFSANAAAALEELRRRLAS